MPKGRYCISISTKFVRDSVFPSKPLEELVARIGGKRVVIKKS